MAQNQGVFQKNKKYFLEQVIPISTKSEKYEGLNSELDSVLLLSDRILAAFNEDLEFNRVLDIANHLTELANSEKPNKVAEDILRDIELWLKVILSLVRPSVWAIRRQGNNSLSHLIREDLDILSQSEVEIKDVQMFYQISDQINQYIFLAYRYRNALTHSPEDYSDIIKNRFLPAGLCTLIIPVYKYKKEIQDALNGLIVSPFISPKHVNMLSLINSERQKHLINFRGREDWLDQLLQKLSLKSDQPKPYILLNAYEGMGKSALVAKITEDLANSRSVTGRNAGVVRKNAPWLPASIVHFGKQSSQPHEIIDILLAQINTLLLEPINIDQGNFVNRELTDLGYFTNEKPNLSVFETSSSQSRYVVGTPYAPNSQQENKIDPLKSESYDFVTYRRVLYLALKQVVKEKGNIVLIVDAVDEISSEGSNLQFLPETLPVGVSALLSARESKIVNWLQNNRDVEVIRLKELKKSEIPVFTGLKDDGGIQTRFNERVWKVSNGWPLMVLEASKLAKDNPNNLDGIQIDRSKDSLFERRVNEWRSPREYSYVEILKEILVLLSIFESVSSLDLDMIQAFLERKDSKYSRDEIKQALQCVSSQIEGLDVNRIKLALKAFAEYVRDRWLGKRDLHRALSEIVQWLSKKEFDDAVVVSQFLNFWAAFSQPKETREISEKLLDIFIQARDADMLYSIYRGLRKHSKQSSQLNDLMKRCLISSAEFENPVAMRTLGWRLVDGKGLIKDVEKGMFWLEKAAIMDDIEAKKILSEHYLDGKNIQQNTETGLKWLMNAVDANDEHAKFIYSVRLLEGDGLPLDIYQGEALLRELADNGNERAILSLANRLIEGDVIEQDINSGETLLRELSNKNNLAALILANRLIDGKDLQKNLPEGEEILRNLVDKGDRSAILTLGNRLLYGHGLEINVGESILLLNSLADAGDADAMRILGKIYIEGDQVPENIDLGKKWLLRATEIDDVTSMLRLATYYLEGKKLIKNLQEGKKWLYKAAETQDPRAMQILGARLVDGMSLLKQPAEGEKWLRKAIEANDSISMIFLGRKMLRGDGVKQDLAQGEELLKRALANDSLEAMRIMGMELLDGTVLPKDAEEGEKLLRKAAELGDDNAFVDLGIYLYNGVNIKQDIAEAKYWLNKAIENDSTAAKAFLGSVLLDEKSSDKDVEYGEQLLRQAIDDGDAQAKRILGLFLIEHKKSDGDLEEGINLLSRAAEEDKKAMGLLADMLFSGEKIPKNEKDAKRLLKKLIHLNDTDAMRSLGSRYLDGDGVEKDIQEGHKLLKRALERGDGDAAGTLGRYYYQIGNFEMATMYLIEGANLGAENPRNNLLFMLRRGEVVGYDGKFTLDELLADSVEKKDLFVTINYALCCAKGFQCKKDWQKADVILASLVGSTDIRVKDALEWWHDYLLVTKNDSEGDLVTGWLVRHRLVEDPDKKTVAQRMEKAREGQWDVPDWMNGVV